MVKNKFNIFSGILPLITLLLLFLAKDLINRGIVDKSWQAIAIIQILVFAIPTLIGYIGGKKMGQKVSLPAKSISVRQLWFTFLTGVSLAFLAFWANFLIINLGNIKASDQTMFLQSAPWWVAFIVSAVIPSIFEELLFRGAMQSLLRDFGTAVSIFAPALCFSVIHMDMSNMAGSFIVGIVCGYLTYSFGSLIPGMIVHLICNSYYLIMDFLIDTYKMFGLVPYFFIINIFLFLILSYFSLANLERLILKNKVIRFQKSSFNGFIVTTLGSPGVVILFLITIMTLAYNV